MSIGTYAQLQTAIAEWLGRDTDASIIARAPDFIALCEAKLNRDLRCYQQEKRATAVVDTASAEPQYITLPSDFQTMRRFRITSVSGRPKLSYLSGVQAEEFIEKSGDVSGRPEFYTIFGTEIELIRRPDDAYTMEMVYRANIPALSVSNTANWLLTLAPDLYLYGSLLETAPYIKEDARIQTWATGFSYALGSVNQLSMDATYNAGPLSMRTSGVTP